MIKSVFNGSANSLRLGNIRLMATSSIPGSGNLLTSVNACRSYSGPLDSCSDKSNTLLPNDATIKRVVANSNLKKYLRNDSLIISNEEETPRSLDELEAKLIEFDLDDAGTFFLNDSNFLINEQPVEQQSPEFPTCQEILDNYDRSLWKIQKETGTWLDIETENDDFISEDSSEKKIKYDLISVLKRRKKKMKKHKHRKRLKRTRAQRKRHEVKKEKEKIRKEKEEERQEIAAEKLNKA